MTDRTRDAPDRVWIRFAENGHIRKWAREPFEGGAAYVIERTGEPG